MSTIIVDTHINAPVERVYAVLTDLDRWPETIQAITRIERLGDGPVTSGTSFKETRVMCGKEHTETMTFESVAPNRGYTLTANSCGVRYACVHTLTPEADGTRLRMEMRCTPLTLAAKVMSPVMGLMMRKTMKKMIAKDFDDVARACQASG